MLACGFVLILSVCVVGLYYWFIRWKFQYWKNRKIPYIKPESLIFGNYKTVALGKTNTAEFYRQAYNEAANYKICGLFKFLNPILLVRDPEIIKNILTISFNHFSDRNTILVDPKVPFTRHLSNLNGEEWMPKRQTLQSAFSAVKMKSMFGLVTKYADELVKLIGENMGENGCVEISDPVERYCIDVISHSIFNIPANSMVNPESEFRRISKSQHHSQDLLKYLIMDLWPGLANLLNITLIGREVHEFFRSISLGFMNHRRTEDPQNEDLISLLLKGYKSFDLQSTDLDFSTSQILAMFMAGYKPPSMLLTSALVEIARNEHVQEKIQMEIDLVLENYDYEITTQSLYDMAYIDRVISETIRRHPISPLLERTCTEEYHIPGTEFTIEKGTTVIVPLYGVYHDPKYFLRPKEFNPDHFSNAAKYSRPRYSFVPFGEGPRHCIAWRLALLIVKLAIVILMQHYSLRVSSRMPLTLKSSRDYSCLKVDRGLWLEFSRKNTEYTEL